MINLLLWLMLVWGANITIFDVISNIYDMVENHNNYISFVVDKNNHKLIIENNKLKPNEKWIKEI